MRPAPIQVECSAGYKADETPRRILWQDRWVEIRQVLDRSRRGDKAPAAPVAECFQVLGDDGRRYLIAHALDTDGWVLISTEP